MRKSLSAPNLTDMSALGTFMVKSPSLPSMQMARSRVSGTGNMSCRAVPTQPYDVDQIVNMFQIESMINAPITQHLQCAITHTFPEDLLAADSEKTKDIAICEAEPADNDFEFKGLKYNANKNRLFLSRCVNDAEITERYATHLLRLRKLKTNK